MPQIDTIEERSSTLGTLLARFGITVAVIAGSGAGYYVVPTVPLYDHVYTMSEYDQIKPIFVNKIRNRNEVTLSFGEAEVWKDMVEREIKACGGWDFSNIRAVDLVDQMNEKLATNSC